ncbi:kinase-like domain-containing protein [Gorgonomyces haynaldii]|nr:kinase-like domain-containing protein [Gorgonomyces haynaldii]
MRPPVLPTRLNYKIGNVIGKGGFATVYECFRPNSSEPLALKIINRHTIPGTQWITVDDAVVPLEIWILMNVSHDNIIQFVDWDQDKDHVYLVTHTLVFDPSPKREIQDLYAFIETRQLSEYQAMYIFKQIVHAVAYLHDQGLVHRDIKDENILIDQQLNVRLIDFGAASFYNRGRRLSYFMGTIQYAAPEILCSKPYDPVSAEVWALGCLLYILATNRLPFSSVEQAVRHPMAVPAKPLSSSLTNLLNGMLTKDPEKRMLLDDVMEHPWFM